ncbi:hypothetical protein R6Y95_05565 [Methanoculleus palmolei]|jgi:hypothetical protein|uniref:PKD domain-containing protein n=3 Tax=Methanoculleus TaxID=45989 RepID=A0ABD8A5W0_9EURY|nr:hypothetical protein [Methanoculleus sp. UBA377]WOX54942.1 hypothetical protein R6Y95_05565 [Methanoculleus palmolei]
MSCSSSPVVTLVEPEDPDIGDPYVYGAERTFTASVDQIATLEFYLDDTLMQTFPNVTEASQPFQIPFLGVHMVRVVARNENGSGENYWTWSIFVTPPEITLIDPAEQEVTDKAEASRLFKVRSNQYAIIRFYLDGDLKQESPVPTQNASYRHESAPLGVHVVSVVATNTNGSGQNHWDWTVYQECFEPAGPYLTVQFSHFRCGLPDCGGGEGPWLSADCLQNAIARYARAGHSTPYIDKLSRHYWRVRDGCPEHCYVEQIFDLDIYIASVTNGSLVPPFGHTICAEHLGGSVKEFSNWKFFQFANLDIQPGDQTHMPRGTETEDTKVQIYKVIGIIDCVTYDRKDPEVTFLIDKNGTVTPEEAEE